jgi:hypothetical protein
MADYGRKLSSSRLDGYGLDGGQFLAAASPSWSDSGTVVVRHTPDVVNLSRPPYGDNFPRPGFVSQSRSAERLSAPCRLQGDATIEELDALIAGFAEFEARKARSGSDPDSMAAYATGGPLRDREHHEHCPNAWNERTVDTPTKLYHSNAQDPIFSTTTAEFDEAFQYPSVQTPDLVLINEPIVRKTSMGFINTFDLESLLDKNKKPGGVSRRAVKRCSQSPFSSSGIVDNSTEDTDGCYGRSRSRVTRGNGKVIKTTETTAGLKPDLSMGITLDLEDVNTMLKSRLRHYELMEHLDSLPVVDTTADGLDVYGQPRPVRGDSSSADSNIDMYDPRRHSVNSGYEMSSFVSSEDDYESAGNS